MSMDAPEARRALVWIIAKAILHDVREGNLSVPEGIEAFRAAMRVLRGRHRRDDD